MAHTPHLRQLAEAVSVAAEASARSLPVASVLEDRVTRSENRRRFLIHAGAGLAGILAPRTTAWATNFPAKLRVAVVGAGLAGLTCAYRLRQAGLEVAVFEANTRLGGRCWTRRGDFAEGQLAERGGELIDQGHTAIRRLVQELGLDLDNLRRDEPPGMGPCFHFDGAYYRYEEATDDLKRIWRKLHRDLSDAGYPTLYNRFTERGRRLDQMSIVDWINESVPGGVASRLGQLLDVAYTIEYGAETSRQSALNLLYLLGYSGPGQLRIFGPSNEKYHLRGGNDRIVERLAAPLQSQIVVGAALVAMARTAAGAFTLTFASGRRTESRTFDHVVLALPFPILAGMVDLRRAAFSARKQAAIRELSMGNNSKLNVQFQSRPWRALGCSGETYSDRGYQASWDVSRCQAGASGILVDYTGGDAAGRFSTGTVDSHAAEFLAAIEPVLPGVSTQWNGLATVDCWAGDPFAGGSYSFWRVGQYTRFAGVEGEREGNCHFAGEHTSIDAQGYLEGAVESGERAAKEILEG